MSTITDTPTWIDPCIDLVTGKTSNLVTNITKEVKQWESMPKAMRATYSRHDPALHPPMQRAAPYDI